MKLAWFLVALWLASCASRAPLKKRQDALRPAAAPALGDDLNLIPLAGAVRAQAQTHKREANAGTKLTFGPRTISREEYAFGLETFARLTESIPDREALFNEVKRWFEFYEVYGNDSWSEVLVTSYFEPEIRGASRRTKEYTQPLLRAPADLIEVATSKYDDRFSEGGTMRGRLVASPNAASKLQLVPYFSRDEIDRLGVLGNRGLELCWVDPIDAFFMQIQGSGTVVLDSGKRLRLGYADQNGHKYESIGKFMLDVLPKDKITLQTIESHLRSLPEPQYRAYLNRNPSYVFFQERTNEPLTLYGTPAVAGRTIATDTRFFHKGTLAFLVFEKPRFETPDSVEPAAWEKVGRFVVDDDTGGAIKGGGRVDLFWGSGADARRHAGQIKRTGKLYYLVPNEELLKKRVGPGAG